MSGWNEQSGGGEGEGMPIHRRTGNAIACASAVTGIQGGYGTPSVGRDRFVTAQRTGTVGGVALSRARTVENLTIVAAKIYTQVMWCAGLFSPRGDVE